MTRKLLVMLSLLMFLSAASSGCGSADNGILHGLVSIGPLQPVETPGQTVTPDCDVYQARKIMVYDESGKKLVEEVDIDCDGRYRTELEPGTYTVDINRAGMDSAADLPATVEIESGLTTRLDISIDTGIR